MADEGFNPVVWLMDVVADGIDWIHETFSDPALSSELRSDIGVDDKGTPQGRLPTGDKVRLRHPNGDPVDMNKAAFDATVAEAKAAYQLLRDFLGSLDISAAEISDVLFMLSQISASESIRARWPVVHALARATGMLDGIGTGEDVEAVNVLRAVDLIGGQSGAPSDTTDPSVTDGVRNWILFAMAVMAAIFGDQLPARVRASYGYEPDLDSTTPIADAIARTAFTIDVSNADGVGTDGHAGLTWIYVPARAATATSAASPSTLNLAFGGGVSHTLGRFTASLDAPAAANVLISRPWDVKAGNRVTASAAYGRADARAMEFGASDGPHLVVETIQLKLELSPTSSVRLEVKGMDLSLALSDADSFISSLSQELKTRFDVALVYDKAGFRFEGGPTSGAPVKPAAIGIPTVLHALDTPAASGSAMTAAALPAGLSVGTTSGGLQADVPVGRTHFGPFRIQKGHFEIGRGADGDHRALIEISTSVDTTIGPFTLTIDRLGFLVDLHAGTPDPNLGLVDLDMRFKPPNGIGVKIDADIVKGGGFLYLDTGRGEYGGVLELSFNGFSVKAVGLLNTRAPDAGWSLLLLLYAEFRDAPLQLGLGFSISAIGGILGLQHVASTEQLRAAMGTNSFDDVLFPGDPVKNAPRILGRLRTLFPVQAHALTFGPVVEINWAGPKPIVVARLGILAQFTGFGGGELNFTRLTVIGTVTATAPPSSIDSPRLVQLTADLLGDYDADTGLLAIDARLRDSKLGGVDFSGSLIIRIGLGSSPAFAVAAGGFHPAFTDLPPALPARIDRLGLVWKIGDSVVLTLQAYAAITASSWQLGALFTLRAKIGPVDIDGALGFDAISSDDGRFAVRIDGHVKIAWRGHTLMAVSIKVMIDRNVNQIWHAAGTAKFSILWWDKEVDFEHSWGTARSLPPAVPVDAAALVRTALSLAGNWATQLPVGGNALVTLADPEPTNSPRIIAHPLGTLTVTQRVAPLGLRLDHLDGSPVPPGTVVNIDAVRVGDAAATATQPTRQMFPRARFQQLSDDERLTQKTFEPLPAGVTITPVAQPNPVGTVAAFDFERVNLAPGDVTTPPPDSTFPSLIFWHARRGRAARSSLRENDRRLRGAHLLDITVDPPVVVVVGTRDLSAATALSETETRSATLAGQRAGRGRRVVEAHEIGS